MPRRKHLPTTPPWAAGASQASWPARSCCWQAMRAATSRVRRSSSTEGSWSADLLQTRPPTTLHPRCPESHPMDPYRLPRTVVPTRYDLRLVPDLPAASFTGEETVAVTVGEPVDVFVLNAAELRID